MNTLERFQTVARLPLSHWREHFPDHRPLGLYNAYVPEELFYAAERIERTSHDKILVAANGVFSRTPEIRKGLHEPSTRSQWRNDIDMLIKAAKDERLNEAHCLLKRIVPEYQVIITQTEQVELPQQPITERVPPKQPAIVEN